jgi:hypothetical protein
MADETTDDMVQGYRDGRDTDQPEPGANRSPCYRHGFKVGRGDRARVPAFGCAAAARAAAQAAEDEQRGIAAITRGDSM